ncbi:MAG: polysaccharide deacetylase family protein, partial [Planctomycetota bacterium]
LALPILKEFQIPAVVYVATNPECENFKSYAPLDRPMTPEEMKAMSDEGISIQSHSHNLSI